MAKRTQRSQRSKKQSKKGSKKSSKKQSKKSSTSTVSQETKRLNALETLIQKHQDKLCHLELIVGTEDEGEYDKMRKNGTMVFARIHAEWCGHCQRLMPEWEDLRKWHETNLKDKNSPYSSMVLASVEDTHLGKVAEKYPEFKANGFPTLLLLKNGEVMNSFEGERNSSNLKQFLEDNVKSSSMRGGGKRRRRSRKYRRKSARKTRRNRRKTSRK